MLLFFKLFVAQKPDIKGIWTNPGWFLHGKLPSKVQKLPVPVKHLKMGAQNLKIIAIFNIFQSSLFRKENLTPKRLRSSNESRFSGIEFSHAQDFNKPKQNYTIHQLDFIYGFSITEQWLVNISFLFFSLHFLFI